MKLKELMVKYSTPASKFMDFEGMKVHYRVTGNGPALLLIHGIGSSLHTWSEWHKLLSDSFTVVSLDNPGFGLTGSHPKHDYSFEMYNRCFNQLLNQLKIETTYMVGNSLGGIFTWKFSLAANDRLKKIVLMDAVGFNTKLSDQSDIGFLMSIHPLTKKIFQTITPKFLVKQSYQNAVYDPKIVTPEKLNTYYDLFLRAGTRRNFSQIFKTLIVNKEDYTSEIRQIETPTLIMWGEEDNIINVRDAYKFKQTINNSELSIYPKVGHLPMEEIPEKSALDTKAFLLS